jgi:hypothetical protein
MKDITILICIRDMETHKKAARMWDNLVIDISTPQAKEMIKRKVIELTDEINEEVEK